MPICTLEYCDTFWSKLRGLMFRKRLQEDRGIILVQSGEGIIDSSIHMFFVFMNLAVIWLDNNKIVVDKKLAKRWRPLYFPAKPARFIIELNEIQYKKIDIGDEIVFIQ